MTKTKNFGGFSFGDEMDDRIFKMLGYVVCVGERAYMAEWQQTQRGQVNSHVVDYWAHFIFELIKKRGLLRKLGK